MNPDVRRSTVDVQAIEKFRQVGDLALSRQEFHSRGNGVDMDTRESQSARLPPHCFQCERRLSDAAETLNEPVEFINGEVRAAVEKQVGRMLKQLKKAIDHGLK